ncbi:MAG: hypothetical protein ABI277_10830 [Burkholderiaceae bacterium]
MQGVLFGLFRDRASAERALAALLAAGIARDATSLHHQDAPIPGSKEERPGLKPAADDPGLFAGLFHSLFNSSGEMDSSKHVDTVRQALHRGEYAVSVSTNDPGEMATAERVFTANSAVLQLHPEPDV